MKLDPEKVRVVIINGREISPFDADIKIEVPLSPAILSQLRSILAQSESPEDAVEQAFRLGCRYMVDVEMKEILTKLGYHKTKCWVCSREGWIHRKRRFRPYVCTPCVHDCISSIDEARK